MVIILKKGWKKSWLIVSNHFEFDDRMLVHSFDSMKQDECIKYSYHIWLKE
jgi:hypothetical protein